MDGVIIFSSIMIAVHILDLLVGYLIGKGERKGVILGVILFPISLFFVVGFPAPSISLLNPPKIVFLILSWKTLTQSTP